jgi:hypothetical protein
MQIAVEKYQFILDLFTNVIIYIQYRLPVDSLNNALFAFSIFVAIFIKS